METESLFIHQVRIARRKSGFPYSLPVIRNMQALTLRKPVTFFIGENGAGKSTLLEAIAVAYGFNAEGGSKNFLFSTAKTHSELHEDIIITKGPYRPEGSYFLRAESFYNLATEIDELDGGSGGLLGGYGGVSLHHQSHGEAFLALVRNRFKPRGLYLLDEPEAALSPMNQIALLRVLHDLAECGSQLIIATHSPILLALPDAEIMLFDEGGPTEIDYEETEHYRVTRDFFENQGLFLKHLLG